VEKLPESLIFIGKKSNKNGLKTGSKNRSCQGFCVVLLT
jgi:hypothetical protein